MTQFDRDCLKAVGVATQPSAVLWIKLPEGLSPIRFKTLTAARFAAKIMKDFPSWAVAAKHR